VIAWRFLLVYAATAALDWAAFILVLKLTGNVLVSLIAGRVASVPFNYLTLRAKVFESDIRHEIAAPKFLLLYATAFFASWGAIELLKDLIPLADPSFRVGVAKLIAEGSILVVKFFVQRYIIFRQA
jgi:putative flippase GtrA